NRLIKHLFSVIRKHALTIFLFTFCSAFQTIFSVQTVLGTIKDEAGKPVPSASVTVKGTSRGAIADASGSFTISASPGEVLLVTSVGFADKEIKVGSESNLS